MSVFILFSIYFFTILLFIVPVPFIIYGIKSDLKSGLLSLLASLLTVGIILEPTMSLLLLLIYGPFTGLNIYLIQKRYSALKVVVYSATLLFLSSMILYGIMNMRGLDIITQLKENFSQSLVLQMDLLEEAGLTTHELLIQRDTLRSTFETVLMIIPAISIISMSIWSYINYSLTRLGLNKIGISIITLPRFYRFRLPDNFAIGTLVMVLTAFIIRWMNIPYADSVYLNIIVLIGAILFVQGLAVIEHFLLIRIKAKRIIKVLAYIIIFMSPRFFFGISILGTLDLIFDLRKIRRAK
ncbi:MAG TPA: DUF2232 domain-containing protein [Tissierellaceae bacterium]|nr:DUF2232 domain-containing protein [Tissierellaceae bacterium]